MIMPWIHYNQEFEDEVTSLVSMPIYTYASGDANINSQLGYISVKYDEINDKIIGIEFESMTTTTTLHTIDTRANLQCPVGKKWQVLLLMGGGTSSIFAVWASNTLDTADGTKLWGNSQSLPASTRITVTQIIKIPANKYLTIERVANTVQHLSGIIVESDA